MLARTSHADEARGEILASQGREASPLELERELGWTPRRLDDVLRAERPAVSLDAPYQGDEDAVDRLGDLIGDPASARKSCTTAAA
jgi:DNA-directed RNA polymerase sigma subunit (sigma70/sigma32)